MATKIESVELLTIHMHNVGVRHIQSAIVIFRMIRALV